MENDKNILKRRAFYFIILLGFVSLLGDVTYEGARSVTGPYLDLLGASSAVVGFAVGFGEMLGYAFRLVSGYWADRTHRYWLLTIVGFALNLLVIPLLAFAGTWQVAVLLLILERLGKGLRTPSRDVMLSQATKQVGRGFGFGLHEAMDQIGAVLGPVFVSIILARNLGYNEAFLFLGIPAVLAVILIITGRFLYPRPQEFEPAYKGIATSGYTKSFWIYLVAVALIGAGYIDYPLIGFHLEQDGILQPQFIALLYSLAMGVDAIAALVFGAWFDRAGVSIVGVSALIAAFFAPLTFLINSWWGPALGMTLWGIGMGGQESVMRAALAEMIPTERRGMAYGFFNTVYGVSWFLGSFVMGIIYGHSVPLMVGVSVTLELIAAILIFINRRDLGVKNV
ncbi:MFS transporter [Coprothermobacter platensis]|uniref:MFS transporter n=1 Tax=Coprothermobacter platensis TaxID=108819 RepID=UPI00038221A5|nr:MFS transporter [Coprothermobacter platensis]